MNDMANEAAFPVSWFYVSFTSDDRNKSFLGAAFVEAQGTRSALKAAHSRGINPGGAAMCLAVSGKFVPPFKARNRLLTETDMHSFFGGIKKVS